MKERKIIQHFTLEPTTGKAIPVKRGQVLRITQTGNGQCLDFNAYNLHDYKEVFHCGRTRTSHGLNPGKGSHLWSAPPRERPMFTVLEDTVGANDVNFPRCSAFLYETQFGFDGKVPHSNCHDILSEAIREYGLTPDDVHDSFNGFMNTGVRDGKLFIAQQRAIKGDYIEMLAQMDVLAVPACCGADLMPTSNYELKGLEVTIFEGTDADQKLLLEQRFVNQRSPEDFRQPVIKSDRPLYRDDSYEPEWPWLEAVKERHQKTVTLDARETALLEILRNDPDFATFTDAEILKYGFFDWYLNSAVQ